MIRASIFAALAVGLAATPSLAESANSADQAAVHAFTNQLTWQANQKQLRRALAHGGYIVTSDLDRTSSGYLTGSALKDGKAVTVGVKMPPQAAPFTN